jgi:glycosyltransferase involved in cell wall biosynthesis
MSKNILFVLPNFSHGGVERLTLNLCDKLLQDGFECCIALRKIEGELLPQLDPRVKVIEFASASIFQFIPELSKIVAKLNPSSVITAFPDIGFMTWIAINLSGKCAKLIHGVHDTHKAILVSPSNMDILKKWTLKLLAKLTYYFADKIVAVSSGVSDELKSDFQVNSKKIHIIYNPIIPDNFHSQHQQARIQSCARKYVHIVALGRLAHQKGFDLLIESMARLTTQSNWMLSIYGDGPEYNSLNALIDYYGLGDRVKLHGFTNNPFRELASADLFVMPSRHEGFGNVLVEALACGAPVIAADCPHGPREILVDGKFGVLIPPDNVTILSEAISRFLDSGNIERNLGVERAGEFTIEASYAKWKHLIC